MKVTYLGLDVEGKAIDVDIEESVFLSLAIVRGMIDSVWAFGAIERNSGKFFLLRKIIEILTI
jgi:hypothetical protein